MAKSKRPRKHNISAPVKIINAPGNTRKKRRKLYPSDYRRMIKRISHFENIPAQLKTERKFKSEKRRELVLKLNRKYKGIPRVAFKKITSAKKRAQLKKKFDVRTTNKGVIVPYPTDHKGEAVQNYKIDIRGDFIVESIKQRIDHIYPFAKNDKKKFLVNPTDFVDNIKNKVGLKKGRGYSVKLVYGGFREGDEYADLESLFGYLEQMQDDLNSSDDKKRKRARGFKKHLTGIKIVTWKKAIEKPKKKNRHARR